MKSTLKTLGLYALLFSLALAGIIVTSVTVFAQPVCNAVSLDLVTDGAGLTRAGAYQCPTTLGVDSTHRVFFLRVEHYPLDNATIQFSSRRPIVKDTGGTSLDPINAMDIRPGFYYLVVWRGPDHQIHPSQWNTPLRITGRWWCSSSATSPGFTPCAEVTLYQFSRRDGSKIGPYRLFAAPADLILDPARWVFEPILTTFSF